MKFLEKIALYQVNETFGIYKILYNNCQNSSHTLCIELINGNQFIVII